MNIVSKTINTKYYMNKILNIFKPFIVFVLIGGIFIVSFSGVLYCDTRDNFEHIYDADADEINADTSSFIKWVDLNASYDIMQKAYELDKATFGKEKHHTFINILAYITAKNGNKFNVKKDLNFFNGLKKQLLSGKTIDDLMGENKYYNHYKKVYSTIFTNYFEINDNGEYGLTAFHPIAAGYYFRASDDFGNARAYGFKRKHLGHDIFGSMGTPVIAVEDGIVTGLGWNKYGGWRIGISSMDNSRYYYYAHLKKGKPYHIDIKEGAEVKAGQVIGYLGCTGYSTKENKNMDTKPHLHFGLQLIFDESQRDGNGEIWVDVYALCKFLYKNRAKAIKDKATGEFNSKYNNQTILGGL